jgi:V/A-type H+-transporting ATPase subunit I
MDDVIEAIHSLRLLHVTEYDGSWEGFDPGNPVEGADEASDKLVTVRSLESILDIDETDAGPTRVLDDEELETELEEIRQDVNELEDERVEVQDELRDVEDRIDTMEPFVRLGIDLDLLGGYDSLSVVVGEGDADAVRDALADSEVDTYEVFAEGDVLAAFARADPEALDDALVGVPLTELEVPEAENDPDSYLEELRHRKQQLESRLETIEQELEEIKLDVAGFLLAAEEQLTVEVQKAEAPLTFATTENAFVAEGWIPSDRYEAFERTVADAAGDAVEIERLEVAEYDDDGHVADHGPAEGEGGHGGAEATADSDESDEDEQRQPAEAVADGGDERARADGGVVTMGAAEPPTIQDNAGPVKPFEALVEVINRPKYSELDPTLVFFLTFPAFFGFMIGDLGYGILYMGIGYWLLNNFDSDVIKSLGGVGIWAGGFTAVFGILYGEFLGLHQLGGILWDGHPPIHKGLQPHFIYYGYAWLTLSVILGVLHLVIGRVFDFWNNLDHGVGEAFMESGSWIVFTLGLWWWVFTRTATAPKPNFMFSVFAAEGMTHPVTGEAIENVALPLGFTGFPVLELFSVDLGGFTLVVGAALATTFVGLGLVIAAEGPIGLVESITQGFGHVVSYTRIAAVLLAKAGMALAVNLLVFGATLTEGEFHLIYFMDHAPDPSHVIFGGLVNGEGAMLIIGGIFGLLLMVLGHLLVLVLGITSAGLQAVRLEYVEFFGKFYEGGGKVYSPFGYERNYTAED